MSQIKNFDELRDYLDTAIKQGVNVINKRAKPNTFDFEKFKNVTAYLDRIYELNYKDEPSWRKALKHLTQKDQEGNELIRFNLRDQKSDQIDLSSELTTQEKDYALLKNVEALKEYYKLSVGWYSKFKEAFSSLGSKVKDFFGLSGSDPILTEEHNDMKKIMENWNDFKNKDILK
jgi:hypothetical protein